MRHLPSRARVYEREADALLSLANQQTVQLDERGRISFPQQFRTRLGDELFISPDDRERGFLVIRSEEGYNNNIEAIRAERRAKGDTPEEVEDCVRDFTMWTAPVSPDKNGRLTIPKELKEYAGLDTRENVPKEERGRAVFVGLGDHAEIWEESRLRAYTERRRAERRIQRARDDAEHNAKFTGGSNEEQK